MEADGCSRGLSRKRELTEFCVKLAEFCEKLGKLAATPKIGWEELTDFSPRNSVRAKKLTELDARNRILRNRIRPVSGDWAKTPGKTWAKTLGKIKSAHFTEPHFPHPDCLLFEIPEFPTSETVHQATHVAPMGTYFWSALQRQQLWKRSHVLLSANQEEMRENRSGKNLGGALKPPHLKPQHLKMAFPSAVSSRQHFTCLDGAFPVGIALERTTADLRSRQTSLRDPILRYHLLRCPPLVGPLLSEVLVNFKPS